MIQKRTLPLGLSFLIPLYLTLWYILRPVETDLSRVVESSCFVVLSLFTFVLFLTVTWRFSFLNTKHGRVMTLLTVGMILWFFAESTWLYLILVGEDPFPSIADLFWIAGYVPMVSALMMSARGIPLKFTPAVRMLWIVLSVTMILIVASIEVIPLILEAPTLETLITVVYPSFDVLILSTILVIVLKFRSGAVSKAWGALVLGFLFTAVGDLWFIYAEWYGQYQGVYDPVDYFLSLGYFAFIFSGLLFHYLYKAKE